MGVARRLLVLARDIKIAHSVFALPFALLATFLAAGGWPCWGKLALIVVCMVAGRTFAMVANRYVDRALDARNPRTAGRALPAGELRPRDALLAMGIAGGALLLGAAGFGLAWDNWWPLALAGPVLLWLGTYGLLKRWTATSHVFLGGALGISLLAAAVAIRPRFLGEPVVWWLAGFVTLWVGGFDVIYAIQDLEVDRREGLWSVPAQLGERGALWVARGMHAVALATLVVAGTVAGSLEELFAVGIALVAILLGVEHRAAAVGRFAMAFFTVNGVISVIIGTIGIVDVVV